MTVRVPLSSIQSQTCQKRIPDLEDIVRVTMTHQWRGFFTAVISKIPCLRSIPRKILKMEIFYKKKSPLPSKLWSDWLWKQLWVKGAWSSVLVQNFSIVLIPGRPPSLWLIKVALQGIYGMRRSISLESWSGGRLKREIPPFLECSLSSQRVCFDSCVTLCG